MAKEKILTRADMIRAAGVAESDESPTQSKDAPYRGIYDEQQVSAWYPINPLTGLAQNDLSQYTAPFVTEQEKDSILARLSVLRADYADKDFTDDELFSLIPPRYLNDDAVDIALWRNYLKENVLQNVDVGEGENNDPPTDVHQVDIDSSENNSND